MTTLREIAANRQNSLKSTGPRTEQGKAVVSRNAVKHGILSIHFLLDGEDAEQFQCLLEGLRAALRPVSMLEDLLVEKVAVNFWRHQGFIQTESACTSNYAQALRLVLDRDPVLKQRYGGG